MKIIECRVVHKQLVRPCKVTTCLYYSNRIQNCNKEVYNHSSEDLEDINQLIANEKQIDIDQVNEVAKQGKSSARNLIILDEFLWYIRENNQPKELGKEKRKELIKLIKKSKIFTNKVLRIESKFITDFVSQDVYVKFCQFKGIKVSVLRSMFDIDITAINEILLKVEQNDEKENSPSSTTDIMECIL